MDAGSLMAQIELLLPLDRRLLIRREYNIRRERVCEYRGAEDTRKEQKRGLRTEALARRRLERGLGGVCGLCAGCCMMTYLAP